MRRQELADADAFDLIVVLHTCERQNAQEYTSWDRSRLFFLLLFFNVLKIVQLFKSEMSKKTNLKWGGFSRRNDLEVYRSNVMKNN